MARKTILVIIAHPDDEVLGLGGTMAKHVSAGDRVCCISLTDGVGSRQLAGKFDEQSRKHAADKASKVIGFNWLAQLQFKDNELDSYSLLQIIQSFEKIALKIKPNIVYTHHPADLNIDHRIVCQAVLTVFRPNLAENAPEIRLVEIPSSSDFSCGVISPQFKPNLFVDIDAFSATKDEALFCYSEEMLPSPHPRSFEGVTILNRYRGAQVARKCAEAFEVVRKVE